MESSLEASDRQSAAVQKTPNRISLASIKDKIESVEYYHPTVSAAMTVAFVKMGNGFILIGKSSPADPENFDAELGRKFALEDAIRQAWPMEAYRLLSEKLAAGTPLGG